MKSFRPPFVILMIGTGVVAILIAGVILPFMGSIAAQRSKITVEREQLARLQSQQRNIATVAKEYDALKKQEIIVDQLFLNEGGSVDFFNAIDELMATSGATNSQLRIDTPVRTKTFQLLGIHLTFNASYRSAVSFIRDIMMLRELVAITNVSISSDNADASAQVAIDAQVPWSQAL